MYCTNNLMDDSFFKYDVTYVSPNIKPDAVNSALRKDSVGINETANVITNTKNAVRVLR